MLDNTDPFKLDFNVATDKVVTKPATVTNTPPRRDLLTHIDGDDYLCVVDNTFMTKMMTCPTSAFIYGVLKRESHAKNAALVFGGALHDGIAEFYRGKDEQTQNTAIVDYFQAHPTPPDDYRTLPTALEVMSHYRRQATFPGYQTEIIDDMIEVPFELPFGVIEFNSEVRLPQWSEPRYVANVHVAWSGKTDLLARVGGEHLPHVVDHKTTSMGGDSFVQEFKIGSQTIGYVWAIRQIKPEYDIRSFCGNAIFLKRPPKSCIDLMSRGPRGGEPPLQFFRFYFEYSDARLNEWYNNTLHTISDFLMSIRRNFITMATSQCFNKYGACPYHDACSLDDELVRHRFLMSDQYAEVTWDPTR